MTNRPLRRRSVPRAYRGDRGSASLELVVLAPGLLLLLIVAVVAGRVVAAGSAVEQAAAAGARAASLARDARTAEVRARDVAIASLRDQGISCARMASRVDTGGFAVALGAPATVSVEVECAVALRDLAVPGVPGMRVLEARMTSPLDRYRGRT